MFLSGLEIDFSSFEKGKKKQFLPNGKEAPNTFSAALIIFFGIFILSFFAVLCLCISRFYSKRIFNDAYYFDDITRCGGPDFKGRTDHELQYRPDHPACRRYRGLGYDDSARFLLFSLRRRQRKYVASVDSLCRGVVLYFFGRIFKHRSFVQSMSKGTVQIGTRAIFTLIIVLVALSESLGAENILGAFWQAFWYRFCLRIKKWWNSWIPSATGF